MKKRKQENLDHFLKNAIQDMELDKVPKDFTNSVMAKIEQSKSYHAKPSYEPLVPKRFWWILGTSLTALFIYLGFDSRWYTMGWFSTFKWNIIGNTSFLNSIPNFDLSDSTVYGLVGFTVFLLVQIFYLKRYFSKRNVII